MSSFASSALLLAGLAALCHAPARATPLAYVFSGVVSDLEIWDSSWSADELDIRPGITAVTYIFTVDFSRDAQAYVTATHGVRSFHADLTGKGLVYGLLDGAPIAPDQGFGINLSLWENNTRSLAAGSGGWLESSGVIVTARGAANTTRNLWVEDWRVGQTFYFKDGCDDPAGTGMVVASGHVTLTSITAIPEPAGAAALSALGALGLAFSRRRHTRVGPALS